MKLVVLTVGMLDALSPSAKAALVLAIENLANMSDEQAALPDLWAPPTTPAEAQLQSQLMRLRVAAVVAREILADEVGA